MADLLSKGVAQSLQEAYDMAVYANPTLRQSLIAAHTSQSRQSTEQQQRAEAARKAGSSIAGSPGSTRTSGAAPVDRSLREEIAANIKAATGRI